MVTAMLDGEVVVESESGTPDFAGLQADLSAGRSDRFRYYLFDLLHLDGIDLTRRPAHRAQGGARAAARRATTASSPTASTSTGGGDTVLEHACRLGLEGIVSKLKTAPYRSGRAKSWLKAKCVEGDEFVIIGYVPSTTQRRAIGSLVLGH